MNPTEMIGRTFGRLTVLAYVGSVQHKRKYQCHCACGSQAIANGWNLRNGHHTSCGCMRRLRMVEINKKKWAKPAATSDLEPSAASV